MAKRVLALSIVLLAAAWLVDMFTQQRLVAAILLTIPVAVASLYLQPKAARWFIVAALAADAVAGWFNGLSEGGHWDSVSIGNRLLAAFSILLVGVLGSMARNAAQEAGRLSAQRALLDELAQKNEALRLANISLVERRDVIRDIVYALSHDLRTPLAAAAMTLRQALDGKYGQPSPEYREILQRSIESNSEVRRLAETLLLVARYDSGDNSTMRRPVGVDRILHSVVDELEPLWSLKHIEVHVDDGSALTVLGDESELRRALVNLFANAIKATPARGTIDAKFARNGRSVTVSIEDSGYGVSEAQRPLLFQRIPATDMSPHSTGSGLGLYIVRRIAEEHGGSAGYRPREPRGSIFSLELPAAQKDDEQR